MRIVIVGAEEKYWGGIAKIKAQNVIFELLSELKPDTLISGHCPAGGVDIWAEGYAYILGIRTEIYKPETMQWHGISGKRGFRDRNLQIASSDFDAFYVISPVHNGELVWNGGEYTANHAEKTRLKHTRVFTRIRISESGVVQMATTTQDVKPTRILLDHPESVEFI